MFTLHPQLAADTISLGNFPLCQLLLMNDSTYPWFILVPRRPGLREIFELEPADQQQFLYESCHLSRTLHQHFQPEKLNIAALGNMVAQLHIHHIVRYRNDPAWPRPIWGDQPPKAYSVAAQNELCQALIPQFKEFQCALTF